MNVNTYIPSSVTTLHPLYRSCEAPMDLYNNTTALLNAGAAVNSVDERGLSPLSLLILHCNRGLRHQMLPIPEIQRLVDLHAPLRQIEDKCIEVDNEYQQVVLRSLQLLLSKGADTNFVASRCQPAIPYNMNWNENFDHKLIQTEQRWKLLGFGATMEVTTYNIFNPLSNCSVDNANGLTILHLAAWRGDYNALQLLLQHGADINARTTDGRNALHFLYFYCNKPRELVQATQLLLTHNVDVEARDSNLRTPLFWLLRHILMKRSHVKYLANTYSMDYHIFDGQEDNYHAEIKDCVDLLLRHGADINAVSSNGAILHLIYDMLGYSLQACDQKFQSRGHYMVPYDFSVKPLFVFSEFLISKGAAVNFPGRSPLHCLAESLRNLSTDEALNSTDDIIQCFDSLVQAGADVNAQDHNQKTLIQILIENVISLPDALPRYCRIVSALQKYRPDFNKPNVLSGDTVMHVVCRSGYMRVKLLRKLLLLMLRCGADPSLPNTEGKYPLHFLLKRHVYHHDPTSMGDVTTNLSKYRDLLRLMCQTMTFQSIQKVFQIYKHEGFWGLVCENSCSIYQTLQESCQLRTLRHDCRVVIWKSMVNNFMSGYTALPLPTELQKYVYDLVSDY